MTPARPHAVPARGPRLPTRLRGFSLLEMLVAFTIMAFSLAALYQATGGTVRTLGDTDMHQRATLLAQSLLNAREGVPPEGWRDAGQSAGLAWRVSSAPYPRPPGDLQAPLLHRVEIVVAWDGRDGLRQTTVTTLLPQAAPPPGGTLR